VRGGGAVATEESVNTTTKVSVLGVSAMHPPHSLFSDRYIGSSPKLGGGRWRGSDGGVCRIRPLTYPDYT
ncbi:MAG: hypothetical protein LUD00_13985, partial [Prevotellaceae bacterium]|nr:hypothetical protein [Prevotellaceae bacterium]